jgi:nicotinamide-nucleotide amidase
MSINPESESLDEETRRQRAERVAELARGSGRRVAVAESLTGGMIASSLAQAEGASEWFCGSLVAYSKEVKHEVLGVPPGPVVSAEAAGVMARRVRSMLLADIAVAITGSGGPSAQDGHEPGTVFLAVGASTATTSDVSSSPAIRRHLRRDRVGRPGRSRRGARR